MALGSYQALLDDPDVDAIYNPLLGCYTVSLLRLLAGGEPAVVSARAKRSSPGVDRVMRADLTLPRKRRGAPRAGSRVGN